MVWCSQCEAEVEVEADDSNGFSCCVQCGRVVEDTAFSSDVMFTKGGDGEGEMVGQMVGASGEARGLGRYAGGRMWAGGSDSHEAAVSRGRYEISLLVEALRISPSSEATETAHRLYRLALQRGFTRGRRVNQVAAVCLYIFCRLERRPYMLIDFSDHLSINVYTLGGVFLQLLRLLRLDEHATFTKPIDPSLFLNRFVDRLQLPTQELKAKVSATAMRLVQSMKRDWMLTGRRPSGVCGAALFLAAHIHGVEKTKKDVISIVHIGWSTVERRVMELAETRDAALTLRELEERERVAETAREQLLLDCERAAVDAAAPQQGLLPPPEAAPAEGGGAQASGRGAGEGGGEEAGEQRCEHVRAGGTLLAHGMCRGCLEEFLRVTAATSTAGTLQGAHDPPAYLRNRRTEIRKRVRAQLAGDGPLRLLMPPGQARADDDEDDDHELHKRRHMENEAALEAEPQAGGAQESAHAGDKAGGSGAGPSGSAAATGARSAAQQGGARTAAGGGSGGDEEEDVEFAEALHSSELQPLACALGGEAAALAVAPLPQRRAAPAAGAAEASAGAGSASAAEQQGGSTGEQRGDGQAGAANAPVAPAASGGEGGDGPAAGAIASAAGDAGPSDAGAGRGGGGAGAPEDEDHLSDVEDTDIAPYLATREEATVREALWVQMNREWIDKQAAKRAAAEAEAADPNRPASERAKRKYVRKAKADLPVADDAAGATRSLLESRKLSNKINYHALADLFGTGGAPTASGGAGGGADEGGAGPSGRRAVSPEHVAAGAHPGGAARLAPAADEDEQSRGVAAALAKRAAERASAAAADADRYAAALEDEQRRRGGGGGGALGGGGGFLDALTFAKGSEGAGGNRSRPQGLLKPRRA